MAGSDEGTNPGSPSTTSPVRVRGDFFRAWVCAVLAVPVMIGVIALLVLLVGLEPRVLGIYGFFVVYWPFYVLLYVAWGHRAYSVQSRRGLAELVRREAVEERRWYQRLLGMGGVADVLVSAAAAAVVAVIYVAQQPELRQQSVFVVLGLLAVAASWLMMCYSFAQRYLRLDLLSRGRRPFGFDLEEEPEFGDYLTIALMTSTMAAGLPVVPRTRGAWRLVRVNTVVAFAFNSVIVAMMVSLLFGGFTG